MTDTEAIAEVRAGRRVVMRCSLASFPLKPETCDHRTASGNPRWRTVACNSDEDVIECSGCGEQRVSRCNFDDEMS